MEFNNGLLTERQLTDIADAIRSKMIGLTENLTIQDMANYIWLLGEQTRGCINLGALTDKLNLNFDNKAFFSYALDENYPYYENSKKNIMPTDVYIYESFPSYEVTKVFNDTEFKGIITYCQNYNNIEFSLRDYMKGNSQLQYSYFTNSDTNRFWLNRVTDMSNAYNGCTNLIGQPFSGTNTNNMSNAFANCFNLTGSPVISENVKDINYAYYNCTNITGQPVCPPYVNSMSCTYENCINLNGEPVCGTRVKSMSSTYANSGVTGIGACGDNVKDMSHTYDNCKNLTTAYFGKSAANAPYAYANSGISEIISNVLIEGNGYIFFQYNCCFLNCQNLETAHFNVALNNDVIYGGICGLFKDCSNLTYLNIVLPNGIISGRTNSYMHNVSIGGERIRQVWENRIYYGEKTLGILNNVPNLHHITLQGGNATLFSYFANVFDANDTRSICEYDDMNNYSMYVDAENYAERGSSGYGWANLLTASQKINQHLENIDGVCPNITRDFEDFEDNLAPSYPNSYYCGIHILNKMDKANFGGYSTVLEGTAVTNNLKTITIGSEIETIAGAFMYSNGMNVTGIYSNINVKNMRCAYYYCTNLHGDAACGNNVIDMGWTYAHCINLNSIPVCGPNVKNLSGAYYHSGVTGKAACGDNVIDYDKTYAHCNNIIEAYCGPNVVNMNATFYNCQALTFAVCGPKVVNFDKTYSLCNGITTAVCGPNVISFNSTYEKCANLVTAACSDSVIDMSGTYLSCEQLTTAVCGKNVINMSSTYWNCNNLTTAACGPNVKNMTSTYGNCKNLTAAVCGPNVINMISTYEFCGKIKTAVCGSNVALMYGTYAFCSNLTTPACGDKVEEMSYTYRDCTNLTTAVCGPSVTSMSSAYYNCGNITGKAACGDNVTNMCYAYYGCHKLSEIYIGPKVTAIGGAFVNCYNLGGTAYLTADMNSYDSASFAMSEAFHGRLTSSPRLNLHIKNGSNWYNTLYINRARGLINSGEYITWIYDSTEKAYYDSKGRNLYLIIDEA